MSTVKAYLINPKSRSITEVQVSKDGIDDINKLIGCQCFCIGTYLKDGDAVFVDDEGLLYEDQVTWFFRVDDRVIETTNPQMLAGKALVLGYDGHTGESSDVKTSLEKLTEAIRWVGAGTTQCSATGVTVFDVFAKTFDEWLES